MSECRYSALCVLVFFFNDTATTDIYTLSLHDALPILGETYKELAAPLQKMLDLRQKRPAPFREPTIVTDRKSTRLNSSHGYISYAVFCLKKKIESHTEQLRSIRNVRFYLFAKHTQAKR